jgi:hypothetical protein
MLKRLFSHGRKVAALIVAAIGSLLWICGLVVIQQAVEFLREHGLAWATTPRVLWSAFVVIVEASIVTSILRHKEPKESNLGRDEVIEHLITLMDDATPHQCRLMTFFSEVRQLKKEVQEMPIHEGTVDFALNMYRVVFPSRIGELFGDDFKRKYVTALEESIKKSKNLYIVAETVTPLLSDKIIDALLEESNNQVEAARTSLLLSRAAEAVEKTFPATQ